MKALMEPVESINARKKINLIFEQIKIKTDITNQLLQDEYTRYEEQLKILTYTIKELQKIKALQGKLSFDFAPNKKTLRIVFK